MSSAYGVFASCSSNDWVVSSASVRRAAARCCRSRTRITCTALANSKTLARLAGMRELHAFLRRGYEALKPVKNLEPFLARVDALEMERLDRIYGVGK